MPFAAMGLFCSLCFVAPPGSLLIHVSSTRKQMTPAGIIQTGVISAHERIFEISRGRLLGLGLSYIHYCSQCIA